MIIQVEGTSLNIQYNHLLRRNCSDRNAEEAYRNHHISLRMFDQQAPYDAWPSSWNRFPSPSAVPQNNQGKASASVDNMSRSKDLRLDTKR